MIYAFCSIGGMLDVVVHASQVLKVPRWTVGIVGWWDTGTVGSAPTSYI